jgi:hypothetical protein
MQISPETIEKILLVVVAFLSSYILQIVASRLGLKNKLVEVTLVKDIEKIVSFISNKGMNELMEFFSKKKPEEILTSFDNLAISNQAIKNQTEAIKKIDRLISSTLFNEVTGRIHSHIESNTFFIKRLDENKESKLYLKDHYAHASLIQKVLDTEKSIFIESGTTLSYLILPIILRNGGHGRLSFYLRV